MQRMAESIRNGNGLWVRWAIGILAFAMLALAAWTGRVTHDGFSGQEAQAMERRFIERDAALLEAININTSGRAVGEVRDSTFLARLVRIEDKLDILLQERQE